MYSVNIGEDSFIVTQSNGTFQIDDQPISLEIETLGQDQIHLLHQDQSLEAELIDFDPETKTMQIRLGSKVATVTVKDKNDLLLEKLGLNIQNSGVVKDIKAPMPGLILELKVKPGDEVKKGDVVLILEAMKMENIIKSPGDGIVQALPVSLGQSVEKNQILIQF